MKLSDVKKANEKWFSAENKRFFGDIGYRLYKAYDSYFVIQITYAFSDMFGGEKEIYYKVVPVNTLTLELEPDYKIPFFKSMKEAKEYAKKYAQDKIVSKVNPTQIQSLLFDKSKWTKLKAKEWAKRHGFKYGNVDVTDRYFRLRQFDPQGEKYRTITFSDDKGIKAIIEINPKDNFVDITAEKVLKRHKFYIECSKCKTILSSDSEETLIEDAKISGWKFNKDVNCVLCGMCVEDLRVRQ